MKKFNSNSQDSSLPPEVVQLITQVNLNCEKTKDVFVKLQGVTQERDHLLRCLLVSLNLLEMNCLEDVMRELDDSGKKNFDEIVKRPIDELEDMVKVYLDGHSSVFQVPFEKILGLTQEAIERVRAFKLSMLDQKKDRLDRLFQLPDVDRG